MATTYYNDIQKLYVAYFNRPGDPSGLAFWEKAVEASNGSTAVVAAEFAKQTEYTEAYKGMTNAEIVDQVYQNLFGRTSAGDTGADFWVKGLDNKTITVADVVTAVAAGAQGSDSTAFNNKVKAAGLFTAALNTDAEIAGYAGTDANAIAKAWLSTITTDTSFATATAPAALDATVASSVAAGTPFVLTGALAQLNTATTAYNDFVKSVDTDDSSATVTKPEDITKVKADAAEVVAADLDSASAADLFTAESTTDTVREALISAQQATNAADLSRAQAALATANTAISKVDGLTSALSTLTSANTALKAATATETAANADVASKFASFGITNEGTLNNTGAALTFTDADGTVTLATIDAKTHKVTIGEKIDATDYDGLTALIAAYNTQATAHSNTEKAQGNVDYAKLGVNMLDIAPDSAGTITANGVAYTEKALVAAIAAQINTTTPGTVAEGDAPTVSQVQTELAVLMAGNGGVNNPAYISFKALVDAEIVGSSAEAATLVQAKAALVEAQGDQAVTAASLTNAETAFGTANDGSAVTVVEGALVFTPTDADEPTVLATINATTGKAAPAQGVTLDVDALVDAYNANVDALAEVKEASDAVDQAQGAVNGASGVFNPVVKGQTDANTSIKAANDAITKLAKDVAALHDAADDVNTMASLKATVDAYTKILADKGYEVVTLNADHDINFATAASDVYLVSDKDASIAAFGLQGTDSLFVGTGFTVVQGAIGDKDVKGSDTAKEIFISTNAGGDAQLQIETHAYSSSVNGGVGEIVTITLTGVDASTLHLGADGIISTGTATA